jgi:hypothetical protein
MTDSELATLIQDLQTHTPLSRINIAEVRQVFARLDAIGYTVAKQAPAPAND